MAAMPLPMEETPRSGHSPPPLAADVATVAVLVPLIPVDQAGVVGIVEQVARARPIKAGAVSRLPTLATSAAAAAVPGMKAGLLALAPVMEDLASRILLPAAAWRMLAAAVATAPVLVLVVTAAAGTAIPQEPMARVVAAARITKAVPAS